MTIKTIKDMIATLDDMAARCVDKGIKNPRPQFECNTNERFTLWILADNIIKDDLATFCTSGSSLDECYEVGLKMISEIPAPEEKANRDYMGKVAAALDFARDNGIAEEYVEPLRGVSTAMTENLLTKQEASE